ncbi:MAG: hypothetical protein RBG13Loki_1567 [Promethearchaeota archaeon CR_4]|nr:MAG: hypothetical protein RBG13Loki_1567 [Candidatus Lokiarchaeota archaeon CR_4]
MSEDLLKEVLQGPIHAQIGKNGLTDGVLTQVQELVKKHGMIKVSVLKALAEEKSPSEVALELEQRTKCFLVEVRGRTFILSKKRFPLQRKKRGLKS